MKANNGMVHTVPLLPEGPTAADFSTDTIFHDVPQLPNGGSSRELMRVVKLPGGLKFLEAAYQEVRRKNIDVDLRAEVILVRAQSVPGRKRMLAVSVVPQLNLDFGKHIDYAISEIHGTGCDSDMQIGCESSVIWSVSSKNSLLAFIPAVNQCGHGMDSWMCFRLRLKSCCSSQSQDVPKRPDQQRHEIIAAGLEYLYQFWRDARNAKARSVFQATLERLEWTA